MMNPVKKIRLDKELSRNELAKLLDANRESISNVERGECSVSICLTIFKKMSLQFEEVNDGILLRDYKEWLKEKKGLNIDL